MEIKTKFDLCPRWSDSPEGNAILKLLARYDTNSTNLLKTFGDGKRLTDPLEIVCTINGIQVPFEALVDKLDHNTAYLSQKIAEQIFQEKYQEVLNKMYEANEELSANMKQFAREKFPEMFKKEF